MQLIDTPYKLYSTDQLLDLALEKQDPLALEFVRRVLDKALDDDTQFVTGVEKRADYDDIYHEGEWNKEIEVQKDIDRVIRTIKDMCCDQEEQIIELVAGIADWN